MKHSDLKSVREYAGILMRRDMPGTSEMLNAMAAEIEVLRAGLREALDGWGCTTGTRDRLAALLPPTEEAPTDAE